MSAGIKFNIASATPKMFFQLLVVLYWARWSVFRYVITIIKRLPIIGEYGGLVMPVLFIALIIFSLPYILQRIQIKDFLVYLSVVLIVLSTLLLYPDSSEYIFPYLWQILGTSVPLYFLGVAYDHEEQKNQLFWWSLIGVIATFLYQIYSLSSGRVLETDNMSASYSLLPSIMYLIYWAVDNKGAGYWVLAVGAMMVSFVFGTRGPILIAFLFFAICLGYKILKLKDVGLKVFLILLLAVAVLYISTGNRIMEWAVSLSETFGKIGFSTRIFDFIIQEDLANDTGRENLSSAVWNAILQRPFSGYGFMGDRAVIGIYVHNIALEFLCSYGLFFGSAGILAVIYVSVTAVARSWKSSTSWFMLMFACYILIKLMLSGSYVFEPYFYLFVGLSIGTARRCSKKTAFEEN